MKLNDDEIHQLLLALGDRLIFLAGKTNEAYSNNNIELAIMYKDQKGIAARLISKFNRKLAYKHKLRAEYLEVKCLIKQD